MCHPQTEPSCWQRRMMMTFLMIRLFLHFLRINPQTLSPCSIDRSTAGSTGIARSRVDWRETKSFYHFLSLTGISRWEKKIFQSFLSLTEIFESGVVHPYPYTHDVTLDFTFLIMWWDFRGSANIVALSWWYPISFIINNSMSYEYYNLIHANAIIFGNYALNCALNGPAVCCRFASRSVDAYS